MNRTYTPGPWKVCGPSKSVGLVVWRNDPGPNPENTGWAQICRNVQPQDAALVAAAPELLAALERLTITCIGAGWIRHENDALVQAAAALSLVRQ